MVRAVQPVPAGGLEAEEEMKSKRIQRKRTRGWRMPRGAVYVGRPSKFSNPYAIYFENGKWFIRGVIGVGEQMKGSHSGSPGRRRLSRGRGGLRFHYTQPLLLKVKETNKSGGIIFARNASAISISQCLMES